MSAYLLKKLRKPGFTTTFLAGMLSNIVVFAEPVSRAANNYLSETPSATYRHINFGAPAINNPQPSVSPVNPHHSVLEPLFTLATEKKPSTATKKKNKPTAKTLPSNTRTYTPTEEYQIFYAPESQGAIGISEEKRFDNARDNFFTVVLPDSIALDTYTPVLSYTLYGLSGAQSTTKSINGSVAYGGEQPAKDDSWKEVEEYLPASLLHPGKNEIFFTRRTDTKYRYHVKDVHIKLYPASYEAPEAIKWAEAAVFSPDNTLESKTITFPTADEDSGSFYALELTTVRAEVVVEDSPEVKVQALPFKDIKPLEQDLINVTSGLYKSFRVSFAKSTKDTLKLHLKYDPEEIPEGYSSKDIRTFIYDKNSRRWKSLPVEAVDLETNTVTSLISDPGGETDYINGIIKVPEHPETAGFAPTTLTDIEFANPAAGIVSIAPPSPNNTGSVTTSFPIKLPPGRNGLQPSLEVVYNSEGGNGWMGMGWDINTPAITLNTKWGVPVFDGQYESELYSLNGQDLVLKVGNDYTAPHRDDSITRLSTNNRRVFYLRKEGSYLEVVRRGISPDNYRWEVTDKFGNKSFYSQMVQDDQGNAVHWTLQRQEDPFGNMIIYTYDKGTFQLGGGTDVQEFYVSKVYYSVHGSSMSWYEVEFIRNVNPGRNDIVTSARNGVLQGTRDLLQEIVVRFQEDGEAPKKIRSYEFEYEEGPFKKQQLVKIVERDSEGNLFYSNTMAYYNETPEDAIFSTGSTNWNGGDENISSPLHNIATMGFANFIPKGSALGTGVSNGFSFGLRIGGGIGTNPTNVSNTIGGSYSYVQTNQESRISFIDINGDGLPDKVYTNGNGVYYRPNTGSGFGGLLPVIDLGSLDRSKSKTNGTGYDANLFGLVGTGKSRSKTKTETDHYFVDFNGDGLPDVISNNRVKFNVTEDNSDYLIRKFDINGVDNSENPIVSGSVDASLIDFLQLESEEELREQYSQFDHVKVWRAPYKGTVSIANNVRLVDKNDCDYQGEDNKFRLTIEKGGYNQTSGTTSLVGSEVFLNTPSLSYTVFNPTASVEKGDLLFFRIHNLGFGCGGEVEWNPEITYTSTVDFPYTTHPDEQGKLMHVFDSENDFMMNNDNGWSPHNDDTHISIDFNLSNQDFDAYDFSGDIRFIIKKTRIDLSDGSEYPLDTWTRTYNHTTGNFSGSGSNPINTAVNTSGSSFIFSFYVESNSNVAWDAINWKPVISGTHSGVNYPSVSYITYDENVYQTVYWVESNSLPAIGTIPQGEEADPVVDVHHNLFSLSSSLNPIPLSAFLSSLEDELPVKINWVIKEETGSTVKTVHQRTIYFIKHNGDYKFSRNPTSYVATIPADEEYAFTKEQIKNIEDNNGKIYSAFYVDNRKIAIFDNTVLTFETTPAEYANYPMTPQHLSAPFMAVSPIFFGLSYRGWGQFLYNGGLAFNYNDEGEITNPSTPDIFDGLIDMEILDFEGSANGIQDDIDNADPDTMNLNGNTIRYAFYNQENEHNTFVNKAIITAKYGYNTNDDLTATIGRFGEGNIYDIYINPQYLIDGTLGAFAGLKQRSESKGKAKSGNLGFGSGTFSESSTDVLNQYIDLNGDRYPDIVTKGKIQYTHMRGGLSDVVLNNSFVSGSANQDETVGVSIAAIKSNSDMDKYVENPVSMKTYAGINDGEGETYDARQWADINGDGLADKVRIEKDSIKVWLNTGYGFSNEIVWGSGYSNLLSSTRSNAGLGAPFPFTASFATGFGGGTGTANINTTLVDVNGDGLPDLVVNNGSSYSYFLNTGTGFESTSKTFYNGNEVEKDVSVSGNVYGSFTGGFVIPFFVPVKATFSPSLGANAGFNEKTATIQDINGDGLPDILYKEPGSGNGSVKAHLNRVGKTHLLKKVNTPLGGSWEVDYARAGNTYEMPQNKWVMSTLTTHDGFTGDDDFDEADNETLTTFIYEEGHHNRREREFFGFEKVTTEQRNPTNNNRYRYTVKSYHNKNYYLKGALKETVSYTNADDVLSRTRHFYNLQQPAVVFTADVNVGVDNPYVHPDVDNNPDRTRAFPALVKTISSTYEEGQALHLTQVFQQYDQWGNITKYVNKGSSVNDAYRTEIAYGNANFTGLPTDIKVFEENGTTALRHREALYNSEAKLERITTHLDGSNTHRVELAYDAYGNATEVHQLDNLDESGTTHFVQEIAYDNILHTYPVAFSDSYGQSSTAVYDYLFGVPVLVTDKNNNSMRTRIDNRGRVIEIAGPNEYNPNASNGDDWIIRKQYKGEQDVENQIGNPGPNDYRFNNAQGSFEAVSHTAPANPTNSQHHAVTRHKDPLSTSNNEFLTVSIVDGFGQAIQLKKKHVADGNEVWQVSGKETKDAFGRVIESYLPTVQAYNPSNFSYDANTPGSSLPPVVMNYDHRNRQTMIQQPNEQNHTAISYAIENQMLVTKVVNELGQTQDTYTDTRGRQRKVVQNSEITTEFYYNCIDELVGVKNQGQYETKYFYDMAGRRVKEQHPDRGATHYTYDNAGRLTQKQTANLMQSGSTGQIEYSYHYHRLLEIDYPHFPQNKVTYQYGDNPAFNNMGRLIRQEDATGIQLFSYNKLGQLIGQMRAMAVAGKKSYWFNTGWEYDSWNRVSKITYPDNEAVTYHYDTAGQLNAIKTNINQLTGQGGFQDIITNITYTDYGERKQVIYGNNTVTNYDYDSRRRMEKLAHQFATIDIDKQYTYDALSNITGLRTEMDDGTNDLPIFGHLAGPSRHTYDYDDYNRLISADGYYVGPDDAAPDLLKQAYSLEMTYDLSHNILSKNQTHQFGSVIMEGDPVPQNAPHAATSYSLAYDDYASGTFDAGGYGYAQPHAPRVITEYLPDYTDEPGDPRVKRKMIDYDANGNQMEIREQVSDPEQPLGYREVALRRHLWDEEDRLLGVDLNPEADPDKPEVATYTYDAGGERSIRYLPGRFDAYYSAKEAGKNHRLEAILYPNSLVTVKTLPLEKNEESQGLMHDDPGPGDDGEWLTNITISKYTKHYYIGSERVASALGSIKSLGMLCEGLAYADAALIVEMNDKVEDAGEILGVVYDTFEKDLLLPAPFFYNEVFHRCDRTHYQDMYHPYWYHPDHLGSSSYITNLAGEINQHMEYLPFGELLVEEHLSSYNSPFKFNAKEFDAETGSYYYGTRYYNPKFSVWLSVDPLALSYPNWSPYAYTYHNPVRWTDSTGMCPDGDCPDDANDGDMHTASDGNTYMHQFGRWSDAPVTDLGNVSGNKGGERESTFEGKFISNGTSSKTQTKNNNIKNAIPCVECHHKTTFNQGSENQWDIFDLEKRQSGYIIYGGKMNSDFIGGTIGEDGVIYGAFDNLFAPSNQKSKIQILKYLIDLKGGLEIGSDLVELFLRGEEDIDFKTFNYTTTDTIWVTGGHREYRLYRPVEKKGYIIDKDTIK